MIRFFSSLVFLVTLLLSPTLALADTSNIVHTSTVTNHNSSTVINHVNLTSTTPYINSFQPSMVKSNQQFTVWGNQMGKTAGTVAWLDQRTGQVLATSEIVSWTNDQIVAKAPSSLKTSSYNILVTTSDNKKTNQKSIFLIHVN